MLPADRDVRQWVAFAGLDPREHSSGTSVHKRPRISKMGNRHLRHVLFMPALVASRREPHLHGFYEHLLAKGKTKRLALMAVARKLLHASMACSAPVSPTTAPASTNCLLPCQHP